MGEITYPPTIVPIKPEIGRIKTKMIANSIRASLIGIKRVNAMSEPSGKKRIIDFLNTRN